VEFCSEDARHLRQDWHRSIEMNGTALG
jgi:hypothetical protein